MRRIATIALCLLLLPLSAFAQDEMKRSVRLDLIGGYSFFSDWQGEPLSYEWDEGFSYGAGLRFDLGSWLLGAELLAGSYDLAGPASDESFTGLDIIARAGWRSEDIPFSIQAIYGHWQLDLDEGAGGAAGGSDSFSFDGAGVGLGLDWMIPDSSLSFSGLAAYLIELGSEVGPLTDGSFDRGLLFSGEFTWMIPDSSASLAAGVRFLQVHQDLPESAQVAPYVDFGFEQTTAYLRLGWSFGLD